MFYVSSVPKLQPSVQSASTISTEKSRPTYHKFFALSLLEANQGGESLGLNDRVDGILCRYSDKTCKKINYISTNTYWITMQ